MTTIGFIGLGIMGGPMAANLVKAGFDVIGYNRSRDKVDALVSVGGQGADDVAGAVRDAEIVITMVPDSPDVEAVTSDENGIFANAKQGALYIDMSSIRPDVAVRVAERGRERGLRVLDAPVSGGEVGAVEASLSIMVGGDAADFEAAKPVLEAVGKTIVHVGPAGAGQTVKAANQLIVAGNIELVAEAIVFLEGVRRRYGGCAGGARWRPGRKYRDGPEGRRMLAGEFNPASGCNCITRIWESCRVRPERPAWLSRSARSSAN
jgi:2-hydroxy-3-oxopropionate reductase